MQSRNENCPCKKISCERHGNCEACREHHSGANSKFLTACERIEKAKKEKGERLK